MLNDAHYAFHFKTLCFLSFLLGVSCSPRFLIYFPSCYLYPFSFSLFFILFHPLFFLAEYTYLFLRNTLTLFLFFFSLFFLIVSSCYFIVFCSFSETQGIAYYSAFAVLEAIVWIYKECWNSLTLEHFRSIKETRLDTIRPFFINSLDCVLVDIKLNWFSN